MNCKSLIILLALCAGMLLPTQTFAQAAAPQARPKQDFPLVLSVTNHSWAFPLQKAFRLAPLHPGLCVGTEYAYRKGKHLKLFQTLELGALLDRASGSAIYFNSDFGLRFTAGFGLVADFALGLGYFRGFHPRQVYVQEASGAYVAARDAGIGALSGNLSLGLGYDLARKTRYRCMPFVRYQWIGSAAYWSLIGIRPNGLLHLGLQIPLH